MSKTTPSPRGEQLPPSGVSFAVLAAGDQVDLKLSFYSNSFHVSQGRCTTSTSTASPDTWCLGLGNLEKKARPYGPEMLGSCWVTGNSSAKLSGDHGTSTTCKSDGSLLQVLQMCIIAQPHLIHHGTGPSMRLACLRWAQELPREHSPHRAAWVAWAAWAALAAPTDQWAPKLDRWGELGMGWDGLFLIFFGDLFLIGLWWCLWWLSKPGGDFGS